MLCKAKSPSALFIKEGKKVNIVENPGPAGLHNGFH
jgi:hypothetical protein